VEEESEVVERERKRWRYVMRSGVS